MHVLYAGYSANDDNDYSSYKSFALSAAYASNENI